MTEPLAARIAIALDPPARTDMAGALAIYAGSIALGADPTDGSGAPLDAARVERLLREGYTISLLADDADDGRAGWRYDHPSDAGPACLLLAPDGARLPPRAAAEWPRAVVRVAL